MKKHFGQHCTALICPERTHWPAAPAQCRRRGSLSLLWHVFPHQRTHSLLFPFPQRWRWAELHAAWSPPRRGGSLSPPACPPLAAVGKAICNANPSSFQVTCRSNTLLLPQVQLCTAKHTMDYCLLLHTPVLHTCISCSMLLSPPSPCKELFSVVEQWEQLNHMDSIPIKPPRNSQLSMKLSVGLV